MKSGHACPRAIVVTSPVFLGNDEVLDVDIALQKFPELSLHIELQQRNIARLKQNFQRLLQDLQWEIICQPNAEGNWNIKHKLIKSCTCVEGQRDIQCGYHNL